MSVATAVLVAGVFDNPAVDSAHISDLRALVNDIGARSFTARLGHRGRPDPFDAQLWRQLEHAGLTRLTSTADLDAGPAELAVVLYGLARHCGAVPLAETDLLAAWLAHHAGCRVPEAGPLTVAIGTAEPRAGNLTGSAPRVPWARDATAVLIARSDAQLLTGLLEDAEISDGHNLAGEARHRVRFSVPIARLHPVDEPTLDELLRRGAWARCIQMMGALDATAALTVAHTRSRKQFGRPLSGFQSVQHAIAAMAGQIERARAVATVAIAAAIDHGFAAIQTEHAVTVCKAVMGRAAAEVTTTAHQLHGALGVTAEHPLWLYTTRLLSWADEFGNTHQHARRLGHKVLTSASPWDLIIGDPG